MANFERTVGEAPQYIAEIFNERGDPLPGTLIDLFEDPQGGAVVLMATSKAPEWYGAIAASKPAGFNSDMLGNTPREKRREFCIRFGDKKSQTGRTKLFSAIPQISSPLLRWARH